MTSIANCFYSAKRSEIKALCYALLASMLVGCDAPGTARLKELCENEGFPKVYQQVSADGYYDSTNRCIHAVNYLVDWGFEFVECKQTNSLPSEPIPDGLYRIRKVLEKEETCHSGLMAKMKKQPVRFKEFLDSGACFSLESIDEPTAKYGLFSGDSQIIHIDNIFGSKISENSMFIRELATGETIAEDKAFSLYPTPGLTISSFQRMLHCNTVVPGNRDIPPLNKVDAYIKPKMTNKESSHGNNRGNLPGGAAR